MTSTERLKTQFAIYMALGERDMAVELASHIPLLLETIDTQQAMIQKMSVTIREHLKRLEAVKP